MASALPYCLTETLSAYSAARQPRTEASFVQIFDRG